MKRNCQILPAETDFDQRVFRNARKSLIGFYRQRTHCLVLKSGKSPGLTKFRTGGTVSTKDVENSDSHFLSGEK